MMLLFMQQNAKLLNKIEANKIRLTKKNFHHKSGFSLRMQDPLNIRKSKSSNAIHHIDTLQEYRRKIVNHLNKYRKAFDKISQLYLTIKTLSN